MWPITGYRNKCAAYAVMHYSGGIPPLTFMILL